MEEKRLLFGRSVIVYTHLYCIIISKVLDFVVLGLKPHYWLDVDTSSQHIWPQSDM